MSRTRNLIVAGGAATGLFLGALAAGATATADTAIPVNPGLPGLVEQFVANSANIIPQQLLQTTSALAGSSLAPAPVQPPVATATLNMPPTSTAFGPGAPATATGLPGLPGNLGSVLPFPMPNFGGTAAPAPAPSLTLPGAFLPSAPAAPVAPPPAQLIPGLP